MKLTLKLCHALAQGEGHGIYYCSISSLEGATYQIVKDCPIVLQKILTFSARRTLQDERRRTSNHSNRSPYNVRLEGGGQHVRWKYFK